ncbi:MAG: DUF4349 domain-containing protein [Planctomycetota bacterium]
MRTVLMLLISLALITLVACGAEEEAYWGLAEETTSEMAAADSYDYAQASSPIPSASLPADTESRGPIAEVPTAADQRKIIFNANIQLVVDEFEGVTKAVSSLAKKHGGFIANSNIRGSEGEPRSGNWTLRIPSQNFDSFLDGSKGLGQVRSLSQDSKEVTAEYVDLQARVRNLKAEEERLHKHLDESTRSLKDILEVEQQLARVRGEIERMQGRLNVLKDLTSLSTVTISIEEIKDYIPEPTEEPGFATQVARTWSDSLGGVGAFFTGASLFVVGFVPWLAVLLPLGFVAWMIFKRVRRSVKLPIAVSSPSKPEEPKTTR